MRVDILAIGSQGDVQPCVALGSGLQQAGHSVRVVTLGGFEEFVRSRGLDHLPIADSPRDIAGTDAGRSWIQQRGSTSGFLRGFVRVAGNLIQTGMASYWASRRDADVLIASPMGILLGANLAERLRVPFLQAAFAPPVIPSRYDWDGNRTLGTAIRGRLNATGHSVFHFMMWSFLRASTNAARRDTLHLPPLSLRGPFNAQLKRIPLLGAFSPSVVARVPDWGQWMHVTGYWFLEDLPGWTPPQDLTDFLDSGPPPVFAGFGSTPFPDAKAATGMIIRALERAGQRGVLVSGGSGLATGRLSKSVISLELVPHNWLFPRVCTAIHHGGAGVTGAALRAGLPSVVVPVFADQPFWGRRVSKLAVGPPAIPAKLLTEESLTSAILATTNPDMRQRAAKLGERIRSEDGIARAIEIIENCVEAATPRPTEHQHAH